jgi:hypothetical protein
MGGQLLPLELIDRCVGISPSCNVCLLPLSTSSSLRSVFAVSRHCTLPRSTAVIAMAVLTREGGNCGFKARQVLGTWICWDAFG